MMSSVISNYETLPDTLTLNHGGFTKSQHSVCLFLVVVEANILYIYIKIEVRFDKARLSTCEAKIIARNPKCSDVKLTDSLSKCVLKGSPEGRP